MASKIKDTKGFYFKEDTHTYYLDGRKMTGVTTVLNVIAKPNLIPWAANMAVDYIYEHASPEVLETNGLYVVAKEVLEEARKAHQRKKEARATSGKNTHALIEQYVRECMAQNDGKPLGMTSNEYEPIAVFIKWANEQDNLIFLQSEKVMYHPEWFVGGTADLSLSIGGKKYVADVKTQKKIWDRVPFVQMSAYRAMLESMGETDYHGSIIIHVPEEILAGQAPLETHFSYDYESDLQAFLNALGLYRYLNNY